VRLALSICGLCFLRSVCLRMLLKAKGTLGNHLLTFLKMGEFEAPLSNRKIREVLGFKDVHDWRKYVS